MAALAKALVEEDAAFADGAKGKEAGQASLKLDGAGATRFFPAEREKELLRDLDALLPAVERSPTTRDLPWSAGAASVLQRAEALRLQQNRSEISPLLLLAALLDTDMGPVREALERAQVTRESVDAGLRARP